MVASLHHPFIRYNNVILSYHLLDMSFSIIAKDR